MTFGLLRFLCEMEKNIGAFSRINKLGDRIYLCVSTSDTIYAYDTKNNMVDPIYIQNPLKTDEDKVKTVPYLQFESSRFASVFIGDIPMPDFTYWVDKESGECSRVKIRNRDLDDYVLAWGTNRDNLIFDILEMPELKKRLKQGKLLNNQTKRITLSLCLLKLKTNITKYANT